MSKENNNKINQDYIEKPKYNTCNNCENMAGNIYGEPYYTGDNVRHTPILKYCHCKIGGFEISFDATCSEHSNLTPKKKKENESNYN